jgi:DNA-binding Lrp family transcriptional regulator
MLAHPEIDEIDRQIVALLRENARRSFQDIGSRVALSAPAVKRRVDKLEQDGVIKGYAAVIDPATLGWNTLAIVELYCEGRMPAAQVKANLERHHEVVSAYTVAGESAAVVLLRARDTEHLERTLEQIREPEGVIRTQTQVVLSTLLDRPVAEG